MVSEPANRGSATGTLHEDEVVLMDEPFTGLNNRWRTPRKIQDSESPELLNVSLEDQSRPSKRDGYCEIESGSEGISPASLRGSLFAEMDIGDASRLFVVGFPGGRTYTTRSPIGPSWEPASVTEDSTGSVLRDLDVTSDRAKCVQGNDLLWLLTPGTGTPVHVMDASGDWFDAGASAKSPPPGAVDGVYMLSRMWLVSGSKLYWSKLLPTRADMVPEATAFDQANSGNSEAGGFIELSPEQGAEPVAMVGWREESLIIFFKNQIEEVVVNPADPLLSTRKRLEGNLGCGARDTVVQVGEDIYFMDQYGQYRSLRRNQLGNDQGVVQLPVSEMAREELPGNLNKKYLYRSQAALLEEFIYLVYPGGVSDTPDTWLVFDLGRGTITGPWRMANSMSRLLVSDIEGEGFRLYGLNGDTGTLVPSASDSSTSQTLYLTASDDDLADLTGTIPTSVQDGYIDPFGSTPYKALTANPSASGSTATVLGSVGGKTACIAYTTPAGNPGAASAWGRGSHTLTLKITSLQNTTAVTLLPKLHRVDSSGVAQEEHSFTSATGPSGAAASLDGSGQIDLSTDGVGTYTIQFNSIDWTSPLSTDRLSVELVFAYTMGGSYVVGDGITYSILDGNSKLVTTVYNTPPAAATPDGGPYANPSSKVYRFFDGRYTDDGVGITHRQTSKAFDLGLPQVDKVARWYDIEFVGEKGAIALLEYRSNENDDWTPIRTKAAEAKADESWPLLASAFPLTPSDFPLTGSEMKVTTMKGVFDETFTGDLPLYPQDLPITAADLPISGDGGVGPGRVVQWRISNSTNESKFEVVGVRIAVRPENVELETEP